MFNQHIPFKSQLKKLKKKANLNQFLEAELDYVVFSRKEAKPT
jgi:hypothetical protein